MEEFTPEEELLSSEEFEEQLGRARDAVIIHQAKLLLEYPDQLQTLEIGLLSNGEVGIIAHVSKQIENFPDSVLDSNKNDVKIEQVLAAVEQTHFGLECRIQHFDHFGVQGSSGLIVADANSRKYILTCSHVVTGGSSANYGGYIPYPHPNLSNKIQILRNFQSIGLATSPYALLNNLEDTALISIDQFPQYNWDNTIGVNRISSNLRTIQSLSLGTPLQYYSSERNEHVTGRVQNRSTVQQVQFLYEDGVVKSLTQLLVVGKQTPAGWNSISSKGDSGSILFDNHFNPVAMIIGGGYNFTYAVPLGRILHHSNTHLI